MQIILSANFQCNKRAELLLFYNPITGSNKSFHLFDVLVWYFLYFSYLKIDFVLIRFFNDSTIRRQQNGKEQQWKMANHQYGFFFLYIDDVILFILIGFSRYIFLVDDTTSFI